jgi:hypothetical protein
VCTPGVRDPRAKQSNIRSTICRSGYTATVRPPTSYTADGEELDGEGRRLQRNLVQFEGDVAEAAPPT